MKLSGGRRHRKTRGRKMRGGNFYGPGAAIAPGALEWNAVENVAANPVTGSLIPNDGSELQAPKLGGRRRRTRKATKKSTKKGGKHRRGHKSRKMRGGASYVSSAGVGAAFNGTGVGSLGNYSAYAVKVPPAGGPPQGADGVYKTS